MAILRIYMICKLDIRITWLPKRGYIYISIYAVFNTLIKVCYIELIIFDFRQDEIVNSTFLRNL